VKFEIFGLVREEALQISSGEARDIVNAARSSIGAAGSVWCGEVDSTIVTASTLIAGMGGEM
jgi:hypothetical protein